MLQSIVLSVCMFMLHTVAASGPQSYQKLDFTNVGFTGSYVDVNKFKDITNNESCTCEVGDRVWFSGKNAPLADYLSVHFRGPLKLKQFAFTHPLDLPSTTAEVLLIGTVLPTMSPVPKPLITLPF